MLLLHAPTCSGHCAVVWNTSTRHFVAPVTPWHLYLCRPHCGRSCAPPCPVSGRLVRATPLVLSQRGSDVILTSPSFHCDCFRHLLLSRRPCHESVLPTSLAHLAVSVSRSTDFLSPLRRLACVAVPKQCPPRPGSCPSPVDGEFTVEPGTVRVSLEDVNTAAAC